MRFARSAATLDPIGVGDHVCWLVGTEEDFAGRAGALVVCAYRRDPFASGVMEQAAGVHPQHLGTRRPVALSFRMFSQGPGCWSVSGVVDAEGAEAFGIAVSELVARSATVQLLCEELELMDAAGMRALRAAAGLPGRRVVLRGVNATVRRPWSLLGFDASAGSMEMAP